MNTIEEIDQLLANLKLSKMREILRRELERVAKTGCGADEMLARLLREQWHFHQERSIINRIDAAEIPEPWELETFPWAKQPGVNQSQVNTLASLDFVANGSNLVLMGDIGVGKTAIATGLLLKALRNGHTGRFIKAQVLFDDVYASFADRSTTQLVDKLARIKVLLIDEFGYLSITPEKTNTFFRLMDKRHTERKTTIITSNIDFDQWPKALGNAMLTAALLSRLRQRCTTLTIQGPDLRSPLA